MQEKYDKEAVDERSPVFPVTALFEDGSEWVFDSIEEIGPTLEFYDSADPTVGIRITDAQGRPVRLLVDLHEVKLFQLET